MSDIATSTITTTLTVGQGPAGPSSIDPIPTNTINGNNTGSTAAPTPLTASQVKSILALGPDDSVFFTEISVGTNGTDGYVRVWDETEQEFRTLTAVQINYLAGLTSAVQTQLNNKLSTSGGTVTGNLALTGGTLQLGSGTLLPGHIDIWDTTDEINIEIDAIQNGIQVGGNITAVGRVNAETMTVSAGALTLHSTGIVAGAATVSATEVGYLDGVTSAIQTQITGKASLSGDTFIGGVRVPNIGLGIAPSGIYSFLQSGGIYRIQDAGRLEIDADNDNALKVVNGATEHFIVDTRSASGTCGAKMLTGYSLGYAAKTANYTITNTDSLIHCTANTFALTLPTAASISGRVYHLKNTGSGTITLNTTSSQTIDGNASGTVTLAQWDALTLASDGANWIIL